MRVRPRCSKLSSVPSHSRKGRALARERSGVVGESPAGPRPFLFVHGAWHGPWCWQEHWAGYFRDAGHLVDAVELGAHDRPGDHSRIWTTIPGHVTEVRQRLAELGPRTVLVGHSMGGLIVQRVLEDSAAAGAVLLASVPRRGVMPATLRILRRAPRSTLRSITTISLWPIMASETLARRALFTPSTPDAVVNATFNRLQNESFLSFLNMLVRKPRPSAVTIPVHVIAAEYDGFFTLAEQHDLAKAYGTRPHIVAGSGHDLMLDSHWAQAADEVLRWAATLDADSAVPRSASAGERARLIVDAVPG
ncbi:MAG TPA: alpha/beta hydrolase [Jiangellaceae bacterium]